MTRKDGQTLQAFTIVDLGHQVAALREKLAAAEQSRDAHLKLREQTEAALADVTAELVEMRAAIGTLRRWMGEYQNDTYTGTWWATELDRILALAGIEG